MSGERSNASAERPPTLECRHLTKTFAGNAVLRDVSLHVDAGEVLAVMGENGAGKSTLIKVLGGIHRPDEGVVVMDGVEQRFTHPQRALEAGISVVHQEFSLLPERTVAQNVFLGLEPTRRLGVVDRREMRQRTFALLERLNVGDRIHPDALVAELPVAMQQMVEIAKALAHPARVVVMDEPTAALSTAESDALFERIHALTDGGVAVLYVSHRMPEVFELADRIAVLRDGDLVGVRNRSDVGVDDIVELMVGRELDQLFPPVATPDELGHVKLAVRAASSPSLHDIDLEVRAGEVVGVGGLEGAGQPELAHALFGVDGFTEGSIEVGGRPIRLDSPRDAIRAGIGLVPADRKSTGLILGLPIADNLALPVRSVADVRRRASEDVHELGRRIMNVFDLRARSMQQRVGTLSGGNQQKVSIGRWVVSGSDVLVLHEPTRGIDIQAKALTHQTIRRLARQGAAALVISSDLPELVGLCDRIMVMRDGAIVGELPHGCTESDVMRLAVHRVDPTEQVA